jgi:Spirocyclase AveC-like
MPTASTHIWSIASESKAEMSTDQSAPLQAHEPTPPPAAKKRGWGGWVAGAALAAFALFFIANCRVALDPRVANPNVQGRPRPVRFTFGLDYITFLDVATAITLIVLLVVFIRGWRRNPGSPVMLMFLCTTLIVWQDPIMNWSPFAVYNPDLIHWPESWPLVSLSPSVEPFVVFGYVMFYFGPYFPAVWILRKLQARKGPEAFVSRHPLICLGLLTCVIGFVMDAFLENTLIHWGMYIYSQVIPWGSVFTGTTFQFPLIWESLSVTFVMIPAAILCYRDDTGKSVAEKLTAKAKILPSRPVLGTFLVMFAIMNVSYFVYGAWFWAIKASHAATSVACPWPYPEAKVYDPQGFYEKAGAQGPYSVGIWSTWASGEPNGRPHVDPPPPGQGACASKNG